MEWEKIEIVGTTKRLQNNLINWGIHNLNRVIISEYFSISKHVSIILYDEIVNIDSNLFFFFIINLIC